MPLRYLSVAFVLASTSVAAQSTHLSPLPSEAGQAQFAAIAEIVALLRDDPATDWAKVDIAALRDHLIDMDNVTRQASVERQVTGRRVAFTVTGDAAVAASLRRLVPAHAPSLQQASSWDVSVTPLSDGVTMTVDLPSQEALDQTMGLGFFGLMTVGAHHQQHHYMMATGQAPH
jgi:hypothetical protein